MDNLNDKLSNEAQSQPSCLGAVSKLLFQFNWTKWKPLETYVFNCDSFLILGRINKKTGMCQFKTKRIIKYGRVYLDFKFNDTFKELLNV